MSTGIFLSIQQSYVPEARQSALALLKAVNSKLGELNEKPIVDPVEGPHLCQGRTGLDHIGASSLVKLGKLAGKELGHIHMLSRNPYRLVYAPRRFDEPHLTAYTEMIAGQSVAILLGSSQLLLENLLAIAPRIGVPLHNGALGDQVARKIDDLEPLQDGEDDWELVENTRVAWLIMHEAAVQSLEKNVPICLAG